MDSSKNLYQCNLCKVCFDFKSQLKRHKERKTPCVPTNSTTTTSEFDCIYCHKSFFNKQSLNRHIQNSNNSCFVLKELRPLKQDISEIKSNRNTQTVNNNPSTCLLLMINSKLDNEPNTVADQSAKLGYVYLIREREFIRLNENTYKIGKTEQEPNNRLNGYPKGSEVLLFLSVNDCHELERQIKNTFDNLFDQRVEYGREYYSGDKEQMIEAIYHLAKND